MKLILFLMAVLTLSSCQQLGYPANCFGPPNQTQVDSHNALRAKMVAP